MPETPDIPLTRRWRRGAVGRAAALATAVTLGFTFSMAGTAFADDQPGEEVAVVAADLESSEPATPAAEQEEADTAGEPEAAAEPEAVTEPVGEEADADAATGEDAAAEAEPAVTALALSADLPDFPIDAVLPECGNPQASWTVSNYSDHGAVTARLFVDAIEVMSKGIAYDGYATLDLELEPGSQVFATVWTTWGDDSSEELFAEWVSAPSAEECGEAPEQPEPEPGPPAVGGDYDLERNEDLSSDEWAFYFIVPEPITLSPGVSVQLNAAPGFWTTGPNGTWDIVTWTGVVIPVSNEGYPAIGIPLSAVPNEDGSVLIVTPPADFPTSPPSWLAYYEFGVGAWVSDDGPAIQASGRAQLGGTAAPGPEGQLSTGSITVGGSVTVSGSGFAPGEALEIWLHSEPQKLGAGQAGDDGSFSVAVTIPAGTTPGDHRIEVRGESGSVWMPITIAAPSTGGGGTAGSGGSGTGSGSTGGAVLAETGTPEIASSLALGAGLLLLLGGGLMLADRRRRA